MDLSRQIVERLKYIWIIFLLFLHTFVHFAIQNLSEGTTLYLNFLMFGVILLFLPYFFPIFTLFFSFPFPPQILNLSSTLLDSGDILVDNIESLLLQQQ